MAIDSEIEKIVAAEQEKPKGQIRFPIDVDGDGSIDGYDTTGDGLINEIVAKTSTRAKEVAHKLPYYARPSFNWDDKSKWINDRNAVNYWLTYKRSQLEQDNDNIKKY